MDGWLVMMCLTPCEPLDCNLPGSFVHGIFQAKNTAVGCHFLFRGFSWPRDRTCISWIASSVFTWWTMRKPSWPYMHGFISELFYSTSLCVCLFTRTILFWFLCLYNITWNPKVWCLQLCFSCSRVLYLLGIFYDSVKVLGFPVKNAIGILMGTALNLWIALGSVDILIIFLQQMNTGYSFIYCYL